MDVDIRSAGVADAEGISKVIIAALRQTSALDYSAAVIERVALSFSASAIERLIGQRRVFVALNKGQIIGTASLDDQVVRTVFVLPDMHGQGVGRQLMNTVVQVARNSGVEVLKVPSSVSAEVFYQRMGFTAVGERFHGEERTVVMERKLLGA